MAVLRLPHSVREVEQRGDGVQHAGVDAVTQLHLAAGKLVVAAEGRVLHGHYAEGVALEVLWKVRASV